jgi:hypothetical protein
MHRAFVVLNPHQIVSFFITFGRPNIIVINANIVKTNLSDLIARVSIMVQKQVVVDGQGFFVANCFANLVFTFPNSGVRIKSVTHQSS